MNFIRRIYVEKKPAVAVEAKAILSELKTNLLIKGLENIRILNCYDIQGITEEIFKKSKTSVFYEPTVDRLYEETFPFDPNNFIFALAYLPGQFDQRADSAEQGILALLGEETAQEIRVESKKVYIFEGTLSEKEKADIKKYMINPVDTHEIPLQKPEVLGLKGAEPGDIKIMDGFIHFSPEDYPVFKAELGLAMSCEDIGCCVQYFRDEEKRNPTISEIKVLDTYWSDHCRHTTFLTHITDVQIEDGQYTKPIKQAYKLYLKEKDRLYGPGVKETTLMHIAQMGMKLLKEKGCLQDLDESEEINACSIEITADISGKEEQWLVMFKNETHNHPTEIEPFGGAATCLGGAIRDPLSGRSYVYQAMRLTGSGDPRKPVSATLDGKLPQRKITTGAAKGYSSYGNQIGLATGLVNEIYHEGYVAKRMEIGAVVGAVKKENVRRERPKPGDVVILVGGRTGRDGCGGATGSSKEHTEESILTSGSEVQKGNPPTERKLQRLFRNPQASTLIKRCNDFGAGGVAVAIGELADGLEIDLSKVPKKYEGLDGTELAISESQERMAVVVDLADAKRFIAYAQEENLEATIVAAVTEAPRLMMKWRGNTIIDIARSFLDTNGAEQFAKVTVTAPEKAEYQHAHTDIKSSWLENLQDLNVAAQKGLTEHFDATIGAATVLMPFGGRYQLTPSIAMAAKLPIIEGETTTATLMSYGFDPEVSSWSPFHGAVYAVVESVGRIVAAGGSPGQIRLSFQEYFEKLGNDPVRWGKPFSAMLGGLIAQLNLNCAAIGGKDSMSGSFKDLDVPPTLVSFALGVTNSERIISPEFKGADHNIAAIYCGYDDEMMPDFVKLNQLNQKIAHLIQHKKVFAVHPINKGGISGALSKMAFGNGVGFNILCDNAFLFQPNYGGFVIETAMEREELKAEFAGLNYEMLGMTTIEDTFIVNGIPIDHEEALKAWVSPLEDIFPTHYYRQRTETDIGLKPFEILDKDRIIPKKPVAKPKAIIPVFPGTNCEYDLAKAFRDAGGESEIFVIQNLTLPHLKESIGKLAELISSAQILALPGGFSAGDEPDGSGKFIATIFRSPELSASVMDLLKNRDGLAIGICNGFQALIKLGLVPFGEIREMEEAWPTLTFNEIGRHISCIARTKIISNQSPWLYEVKPGDVHHVALSHGEGRFVAGDEMIQRLHAKGQIATQYVDFNANGSMDIRHNPNGSAVGIEGILSPDGRVFGKMGHTERAGKHTFINVPGDTDQKIFTAGVKYFS